MDNCWVQFRHVCSLAARCQTIVIIGDHDVLAALSLERIRAASVPHGSFRDQEREEAT